MNFDGFLGTVERDVLLSKATYYRIGGPAKYLVTPKTIDDLQLIHREILKTGIRFFALGWGSNLLFSDRGFDGLIIRFKHLNTEASVVSPGKLRLGASLGASVLLRQAQASGWGGLSFMTGIPGSIGGMVAMNAGTHLGEMKDCVTRVDLVNLRDPDFHLKSIHPKASDFSYRRNHFLGQDDVIVGCEVNYHEEDPSRVKKEIDELYLRRKQTQPVDLPSCGSVFMNPKEVGKQAWQVVDELGLRGYRVGNAQISEKHSNFIVNLGQATASDVRSLIDLVKTRALKELGIVLNEEVKYIE